MLAHTVDSPWTKNEKEKDKWLLVPDALSMGGVVLVVLETMDALASR